MFQVLVPRRERLACNLLNGRIVGLLRLAVKAAF